MMPSLTLSATWPKPATFRPTSYLGFRLPTFYQSSSRVSIAAIQSINSYGARSWTLIKFAAKSIPTMIEKMVLEAVFHALLSSAIGLTASAIHGFFLGLNLAHPYIWIMGGLEAGAAFGLAIGLYQGLKVCVIQFHDLPIK